MKKRLEANSILRELTRKRLIPNDKLDEVKKIMYSSYFSSENFDIRTFEINGFSW